MLLALLAVQAEQARVGRLCYMHVVLLIGDCVNCQSHRAIYIYIILPSPQGVYEIYCPGGVSEHPRKWATNIFMSSGNEAFLVLAGPCVRGKRKASSIVSGYLVKRGKTK